MRSTGRILFVFLATWLSTSAFGWTQAFQTLATFESLGCPGSSPVLAPNGVLYATAACGGTSNNGAVVTIAPEGHISVLHSFSGTDGSNPQGDLLLDEAGNLYGTTLLGGTSGVGTVYEVSANGTFSVLHNFDPAADGSEPEGGLIRDRSGNLYGTTFGGGPGGEGSVFELAPGGAFSVLHAFTFPDGGDGYAPSCCLLRDAAGDLFGTTYAGGPAGGGVVYKLTPDGGFSLLHAFVGGTSDSNGAEPFGLVSASGGALVGLTASGGSANETGTAFKLAADGTLTVMHIFANQPSGGLTPDRAGNVYGVTPGGGPGEGSVYKLTPDGTFTTVYIFTGAAGVGPTRRPFLDGAGNLYFQGQSGGTWAYGGFTKLAPGGQLTVLGTLTLTGLNGGLVLDANGHLFGTTQRAGAAGGGSVFKVDLGLGSAARVHGFSQSEGQFPTAGVALGTAGHIYGTLSAGGDFGSGLAYRLQTGGGPLTVLHAFGMAGPSMDGTMPVGRVVLDAGDNLYGATQGGGSFGAGTVFRVGSDGSYSLLHEFGSGPPDGALPSAGVSTDAAGNLYGTALFGGKTGAGIAFRLSPAGDYAVLHAFAGSDGAYPMGAPVVDSDGNVYGTTSQGGGSNLGNVFRIAPDGTFTVLHDFAGADGATPQGDLVLDSRGTAYGTTTSGGAHNLGTIFQVASDGSYAVLHSFGGLDGFLPLGGLVLDGNVLYGTASGGGPLTGGVVFRLELP